MEHLFPLFFSVNFNSVCYDVAACSLLAPECFWTRSLSCLAEIDISDTLQPWPERHLNSSRRITGGTPAFLRQYHVACLAAVEWPRPLNEPSQHRLNEHDPTTATRAERRPRRGGRWAAAGNGSARLRRGERRRRTGETGSSPIPGCFLLSFRGFYENN